MAAIMFTDMVGYTTMGQKNESLSLALVEEQRNLVRPILRRHEGTEIKTMGDAFLVEFPNALDAVRCAYDIQRASREYNISQTDDRRIRLRIGLHLGDVEEVGGDILGDAVNQASRIEPLAEEGGVCLTRQVHDSIRGKFEIQMKSLGPRSLKNVGVPVEVYKMVMPWATGEVNTTEVHLDKNRVAILPFRNMSPDPNDEYFAEGITEELISTVSKIRDLTVISRTSVMKYRNPTVSTSQIGQDLRVGSLLEGSVRKAGNKVRITAQLIDVQSDGHLWSQSYDRELNDVFGTQADIAEQVAGSLKVQLLTDEKDRIRKRATDSPEAYTLYLKGMYYWNERTRESIDKAIRYFGEATRIDPHYALAYVGLSQSYMILENWGYVSAAEVRDKRMANAKKALELDDTLAEAHAMHASILMSQEWDFEGAEKEFQRAIELNPNSVIAHHWYGNGLLGAQGRVDEAVRELRLAKRLDPLSPMVSSNLGDQFLNAGRHREAEEEYLEVLRTWPDFQYARERLGMAFLGESRFEEAISVFQQTMQDRPVDSTSDLIYAYVRTGRVGAAKELMLEVEAKSKKEYVSNMQMAFVYAAAGENEKAMNFIQETAAEKSNQLWINLRDPILEALRPDPRFQNLLKVIEPKTR